MEMDMKKVRSDSVDSNSDQETIQINIRNSPALERMNKKKLAVAEVESSEDEIVDKFDKNRSRSPSPSKAR